ncbi:MAG: formylglycine-generating enzyme family protein, partial [bacterium]|nr:formylglycine-generating enzyme family protein [bacterium]
FCNALSRLEECRVPGFSVGGPDDASLRAAVMQPDADGYRLATEAEWEFAARAGKTTDDLGDHDLGDYAWFSGNADQPQPVGTKLENPWGLHDMLGTVWEWCVDGWHSNYEGAPADGSAWNKDGDGSRVLRGGSFVRVAWFLRSAYRLGYSPENRVQGIGFRCVRAPLRQS